jgi:hypothetical protein
MHTVFLVGKHEGKRPHGRLAYMLMDNIKMDLREMKCKGVKWVQLALYRVQWCRFFGTKF